MYPQTKQLIATYLAQETYPGVAYAFSKGNRIEQSHAGFAQLLPVREKLTRETLFDVASLTKVICTNSVILKLIEDETICLDDPLQSHLPAYCDQRVTIRHLLTHTSDINPYIENRDLLAAPELKQALLQLASGQQIGQQVAYTDTGTLLLGFLIEELYQQPVQLVCQQQVLTPLMMTNSTFSPTATACAATAVHPTRGLIRGQVHDPKAFVLGKHCGSAGLFSNLTDCLQFAQMILAGGITNQGQRFLQEKTINDLFQDQTPTKTLQRSLGWDLKSDLATAEPLLFHTGYTGTFMLLDKKNQEAFIFLSNRVHPTDKRVSYLAKRDQIIATYLKEKSRDKENLL